MDTATEMNRALTPQPYEISSPLPGSPDARVAWSKWAGDLCSRWAPIAALVLAFGIRVVLMKNDPLFVDELFEAREPISQSVLDNFVHFRPDSNLLHVLLTKPMAFLGWDPFLLRWPSLLAGVISLPLCYRLGRKIFNDRVGLLAAAMLGVVPAAVIDSIWIRGYSLMIPLSLLSCCFFLEALQSGRLLHWVLFGLGVALLSYAHTFGALLVAPALIFAATHFVSHRSQRPQGVRNRLLLGASIALSIVIAAVLSIAWLMRQSDLHYVAQLHFSDNWGTDFPALQLSDLKRTFLPYLEPMRRANFTDSRGWPFYYYGSLVLLGTVLGVSQRRYRGSVIFLLLVALVPMLLITLGQTVTRFQTEARYLDFALFAYVLLSAFALWWLSSHLARKAWPAAAAAGLLATGILVFPAHSDLNRRFATGDSQRLVEVAHHLRRHASPDDLVFCVARDGRRVHVREERCLLTLHFYPDLADQVLPWEDMSFVTWQNLIMLDHRCTSTYYHMPQPGLRVACGDGKNLAPQVWLVLWQRSPTQNAFTGDSSLVEAQYGDTRLIRIVADGNLSASLRKAGEVILADDAVSPERSIRNRLALANLYASLGDTNQASALLELSRQQLQLLESPDRGDLVERAALLQGYLPYLGGSVLPEISTRATWGNQIELRGYTVQPHLTADGSYDLTVTMFWQALHPLPKDYTFFLHWRDARGQTLRQADFLLYDGRMPFWDWSPGYIMRETRTLHVPAPEPGAPFRLVAGIYDLATGERLPLLDDSSGENVLELTR